MGRMCLRKDSYGRDIRSAPDHHDRSRDGGGQRHRCGTCGGRGAGEESQKGCDVGDGRGGCDADRARGRRGAVACDRWFAVCWRITSWLCGLWHVP